MPLVPLQTYDIWIDAPNILIGATEVKRKIKVTAVHIDYTGNQLVMYYTVYPFAKNADDTYGDLLVGNPLFTVQTSRFVANNSSLVIASGEERGKVVATAANTFSVGSPVNIEENTLITILETGDQMTYSQADAAPTENTPAGPLHGIPVAREWDYYFYAAENEPIVVGNIVRNTFTMALAAGRI